MKCIPRCSDALTELTQLALIGAHAHIVSVKDAGALQQKVVVDNTEALHAIVFERADWLDPTVGDYIRKHRGAPGAISTTFRLSGFNIFRFEYLELTFE